MIFRCIRQFTIKLLQQQQRFLNVGVVGAPFCGGNSTHGVELAPKLFRDFGLPASICNIGHKLIDYGDLCLQVNKQAKPEWDLPIKYGKDVFEANRTLSTQVQAIHKEQDVCVMLGGDHCLGIGSVHGTAQVHPNLSVLWIDAHADINTLESTSSKNAHGMPLSFLIKEIYDRYNRSRIDSYIGSYFQPCLPAANLAYIGLHDIERKELALLKEFNITHFTMADVDRLGIQKVLEQALSAINPKLDRPMHVSVDIDSMDGPLVPNTILPTPGGLTLREILTVGESIFSTGLMKALDLVEVNPLLGTDIKHMHQTVEIANNIILSFLGRPRIELYSRCS